jgi:hypothetical protein
MTKSRITFIIKFISPYVSILAGALASWILVNLKFLGAFHVNHNQVAQIIASVIIFVMTSALTYLSSHTQVIPALERWALVDTPVTASTKEN